MPNFARLGPRVGKLMPALKKALAAADPAVVLRELDADGQVSLDVSGQQLAVAKDDIELRLQAKEGWTAARGPHTNTVVVLSTELTDDLVREGYARDVVRLIQERRKQLQCDYTDRIEVGIVAESAELRQALEENTQFVQNETLAQRLVFESLADVESVQHKIADAPITIYVEGVASPQSLS